jgi:glycosyltransferase involved in cell wall biosynthesis
VAIVNARIASVRGGAEELAEELARRLRAHGHEAEIVGIPFDWRPAKRILGSLREAEGMRLENVDRVVALKFPAWAVPHPDKVVWMLHQHRGAYDRAAIADEAIRDEIRRADDRAFGEASRLLAISEVVAARAERFNGVRPGVLHPPLPKPELYRAGDHGDYLFFPSRLDGAKRQALAIEAMRHVRSPVRLVIAGATHTRREMLRLRALIVRRRLRGRVTLLPRWISDEQKAELYANARAVIFPPLDEDYGFVTLEAYASAKAVITCTDSGGPTLFVRDGETGFIAPADPQALAERIDELGADAARARQLGTQALDHLRSLGLNWDHVVAELTG